MAPASHVATGSGSGLPFAPDAPPPRPFPGGWLLIAVPLGLSAFVYRLIPRVYFSSDDFFNLYQIVNTDTAEFLLRPHGGHLLLVRNAIFALYFRLFGPDAGPYFWTVYLTHLVNVALLFHIVRRVTRNAFLAAFGATLWGTCPVHTGTLTWYSVYGQVVATTVILIVLDQVARSNAADVAPRRLALIGWPALLLVASTCFGVAIGVTMSAPLACFLLLPPTPQRRRVVIALTALAVALPFIYNAFYAWHAQAAGTQPVKADAGTVVAWVRQLLADGLRFRTRLLTMLALLLGYGISHLLIGFARLEDAFPDPLSVGIVVLYVGCVITAFVRSPSVERRHLLSWTVLVLGCYGIIAAGRGPFFQVANMWFAASQMRYQYLGSLLLAVLLCVAMPRLLPALRPSTTTQAGLLLAWTAAMLVFYATAQPFIDVQMRARREVGTVLSTVRAQINAAPPGADVYIPNQFFQSAGVMIANNEPGFPGWAAIFTIYFPSNVVAGRRVYFVVDNPKVIEAAKAGRRTATLIKESDQLHH